MWLCCLASEQEEADGKDALQGGEMKVVSDDFVDVAAGAPSHAKPVAVGSATGNGKNNNKRWIAFCLREHRVRSVDVSALAGAASSALDVSALFTQIVPLEALTLPRIAAFVGSAFSATGTEVIHQVAGRGAVQVTKVISSIANFFGASSPPSSSPATTAQPGAATAAAATPSSGAAAADSLLATHLLGDSTVDRARFAGRRGESRLALRDAGLDVNVPFLFSSADGGGRVVQWVLDSGSDGAVGYQLTVAERHGHLGKYSVVFTSAMAAQQMRAARLQHAPQQDAAVGANQQQGRQLDDEDVGQWAVYLKDSESDRGAPVIVYICALNVPETMEVADAGERVALLRVRYRQFRAALAVISKLLVSMGF